MYFVQPRTVLEWQKKRFRDYWRDLSRTGKPGRPSIAPELIALIWRMWSANPAWGSPRIVLELKKLGIDVAKSTVERYQPKGPRPGSPGWRVFLRMHAKEFAAMDFFVVPTAELKVLFVLDILGHERRRVLHFNVTEHPTAEWTAQQLVEAFPFESAPRYLLRDGDAIYGGKVGGKLRALGIEEVVTAPSSPWQNAYAERLIGSIRREMLDHVVVLNDRHLRRLLKTYVAYYNRWRTHRSLEGDAPDSRPVLPAQPARIAELPAVHGLHHYYLPEAA
ncbi:MAG: integrase core domain-containing protein [Gammaproteobacteria bacterium]|nr:integrase core domain-containing protein [Gammaproteobacteria bacterium]